MRHRVVRALLGGQVLRERAEVGLAQLGLALDHGVALHAHPHRRAIHARPPHQRADVLRATF